MAKIHRTTSSRVERAIRHSIELAWKRPPSPVLNDVFTYQITNKNKRPTNSELIAMVADYLTMKHKKEYHHKLTA